jgi:hypothetical protein
MQCEDIAAQIAAYLAASLGGAERGELESHIASCAACREELEQASKLWRLLGEIPAETPDSHTMRARLDAEIAASLGTQAPASLPSWQRRAGAWLQRHAPLRPLLEACAALLLLLLGVELGRGIRTPQAPAPDLTELTHEVRDLRQMVTLSLLQQPSASERLKGVSWSSQLERPSDEVVSALIDTLMHDPNVNVRLASIDALKRFAERDIVRRAALQALDTQRSPLVQMALIDFVVETREQAALGTLRRLSRDGTVNESVRMRATWAIDHLEIA